MSHSRILAGTDARLQELPFRLPVELTEGDRYFVGAIVPGISGITRVQREQAGVEVFTTVDDAMLDLGNWSDCYRHDETLVVIRESDEQIMAMVSARTMWGVAACDQDLLPLPSHCAACERPEASHGVRYRPGVGNHRYITPRQGQSSARLWFRFRSQHRRALNSHPR